MSKHAKWMVACLVAAGLNFWLVPAPLRGVLGLFIGMFFGYHLARWDEEL